MDGDFGVSLKAETFMDEMAVGGSEFLRALRHLFRKLPHAPGVVPGERLRHIIGAF